MVENNNNVQAQEATTFSVGVAQTKPADQAGSLQDRRKNEMFQVDTSGGAKMKRGREEFAEKLRKQRK